MLPSDFPIQLGQVISGGTNDWQMRCQSATEITGDIQRFEWSPLDPPHDGTSLDTLGVFAVLVTFNGNQAVFVGKDGPLKPVQLGNAFAWHKKHGSIGHLLIGKPTGAVTCYLITPNAESALIDVSVATDSAFTPPQWGMTTITDMIGGAHHVALCGTGRQSQKQIRIFRIEEHPLLGDQHYEVAPKTNLQLGKNIAVRSLFRRMRWNKEVLLTFDADHLCGYPQAVPLPETAASMTLNWQNCGTPAFCDPFPEVDGRECRQPKRNPRFGDPKNSTVAPIGGSAGASYCLHFVSNSKFIGIADISDSSTEGAAISRTYMDETVHSAAALLLQKNPCIWIGLAVHDDNEIVVHKLTSSYDKIITAKAEGRFNTFQVPHCTIRLVGSATMVEVADPNSASPIIEARVPAVVYWNSSTYLLILNIFRG
jgi:hypothetical protein